MKVVVFGATGSIGKAVVEQLLEENHTLYLFTRQPDKLRLHYSELIGSRVFVYKIDLNSKTIEEDCSVDSIVYAAGTIGKSYKQTTLTDWNNVMKLNLDAVFLISKVFIDILKKNSSGSIVLIASTAAYYAGKPSYVCSKAGLLALSKCLALEFASYKIRVNCVSPGYVTNESSKWDSVKLEEKLLRVPTRKISTSEDIAHAVCFLLDNSKAGNITGASLDVNGGMYMR